MNRKVLEYNAIFQKEEDGGYSVWVPSLPGCASQGETFEEAMQRLNITEAELNARRKEFTRLMFIYLAISLSIFAYTVYIVTMHKNFMGFMMGFAITIYSLTYVFKYHFWIYQIKHKKLGCTLREWFLYIR